MKNLIKLLTLLFIISLTTVACNKDAALEDFDQIDHFDEPAPGDFVNDDDDPSNDDPVGEPIQNDEDAALTLYRVSNGTLMKIKDYDVSEQLKPYQEDVGRHMRMWDFYTRLIPEEQIAFIKEFEVFLGSDELAGFVTTIGEDNSRWKLGLAVDLSGSLSDIDLEDEMAYVSIHEQAHILTLNHTQLQTNVSQCLNFELEEGCAKSNAYINRLFELGWADIYDEFQNLSSDADFDDFYNKYSSRFVTSYAATNPAEDIAEVFTYYVIADQLPSGNSIADQKIRLMSQFPELVALRDHIRRDPVTLRLKPGGWKRGACKHHHHHHLAE